MIKKSMYLFTTLFVVFGILVSAGPAFALTGTRHAKGRVIAINRRTHVMTVKTTLGTKVRLKYSSLNTRLWHNGVRIGLWRLHVGNSVDAGFTPPAVAGAPGIADDVDDNLGLFEVTGTVAAVDTTLGTVSVASNNGGSTVILKVDSTTAITRNGMPATLADLLFGDRVEAKYNSATMLASFIKVEDSVEASEVEGSITAVDSVAGTITISGEGDGGGSGETMTPTDVTLNVTSATVVMLDESPAPLASLQVGMQAEAQYDPATMNASFVEAETQGSQESQQTQH